MIAANMKSRLTVVMMVAVAVISLTLSAGAALPPTVSTLAPLEKGLQTPLKMALDVNGDIYVADPRSGGVVQLDQYGVVKKVIPTQKMATAVAVLNTQSMTEPKLLVVMGDRVIAFNQNGVALDSPASDSGLDKFIVGSGVGQFVRATGIAVDAKGYIYVSDAGAKNVKIFAPSGAFDKSFGVFSQPVSVAVVNAAAGQQIAVLDAVTANVQFFTTSGDFIKSVGSAGDLAALAFRYPLGLAFENKLGIAERMYVLDSYHGYLQSVDLSAEPAAWLGNVGASDAFASAKLITPSDVIFDSINKRLLVSNGMSNIISFGIDGGSNPIYSAPLVFSVENSAVTVYSSTVTLKGAVESGASITSSVNTTATVAATSFPSSGSWMLGVSNLLPGLNTVSITAANQYGVTATKTVAVTYIPPSVQLTVDSYSVLTKDAMYTLTGTVENGSKVTVYNFATDTSNQASVIDGIWICPESLVEGTNSLVVTAVKEGKSSAKKEFAIDLDTKSPVINASLLSDGSSSSSQVLGISGTVADAHLASFTINAETATLTNGEFNTAVNLNLGKNVITISAVDQLGNVTTDTRTISFDPALPQVVVQSPVDGLITSEQNIVVATSAADALSVTVNGQPTLPGAVSGEFTATVKLTAGLNTIIIDAVDQFGRTAQAKRTVTFDAVKPIVTISSPSQEIATNKPGVTVSGTVTDNTAISGITATVNGTDVPLTITNGVFTFFAEFSKEQAYSIAVTVTDSAKNISTALRTVLYDVTPPDVSVADIKTTYPTALSGTVEIGSSVVVSDAAGFKVAADVVGNSWTSNLTGVTYDAASLSVTATDAAGNSSVKTVLVPIADGDVDKDGVVTVLDALTVIRLVVSNTAPTQDVLNHGDVGPLLNGKRNANGRLELGDGILILRKALGLSAWL